MAPSTTIRDVLVKIGVDNSALDKGLDAAQGGLKAFAVGAGAALGAATVAFGALTAASIRSAAEIDRFARVSSTTTTEFQRMAAGARTVGIDADKLADIFKDVNDRVGDFNATGAGPMADFFEQIAPRIGLTADAFKNLSGPQALQLYVSSLEKAGASQQDMTFYLEAMASDTTALIPLLRNGGAEMNRLADNAQRLGAIMSDETIASLNDANRSFRDIQATTQGFANEIIASLAPALASAAEGLSDALQNSEAVQGAVDGLADAAGGLANILGSEDFISAAIGALTALATIVEVGAKGMILLSDNVGIATGAVSALAIAVAALGGPISIVAGLVAAAGAGMFTMAQASGEAERASGGFGQAIDQNATKLIGMANASKTAREELAKLIALQTSQAAGAAELIGESMDRLAVKIEDTKTAWNGRAAGMFENAPDIGAMEQEYADLADQMGIATAAARALQIQREEAQRLAAESTDPITGGGVGDRIDPSEGGSGSGDKNDLEQRLERLRMELASEAALQQEWYEANRATLAEALASDQITRDEYHGMAEALEQEHLNRMQQINDRANQVKMQSIKGALGDLSSLMDTNSKKLFKIGQAAAVANAVVDGWAAATSAWKYGMAAGGPPLAAAFTAASLARTGAMIASIASQKVGGGSGGGSNSIGGNAGSAPAEAAPRPLDVRMTGLSSEQFYSGAQIGNLLDLLNQEAGDRGYTLMRVQ